MSRRDASVEPFCFQPDEYTGLGGDALKVTPEVVEIFRRALSGLEGCPYVVLRAGRDREALVFAANGLVWRGLAVLALCGEVDGVVQNVYRLTEEGERAARAVLAS